MKVTDVDTSRLFEGLVLLTITVLSVRLVMQIDGWRSAVLALHLRWEREQRQAGPDGVALSQRQSAQTQFEKLVTNRPMRLFWMHFILGLAAVTFALLLGWNQDDLRWVGLWLVIPLGISTAAILGYALVLVNQANIKLASISSTLYGPAPPRVKVRHIQTMEQQGSSS